MVEIIDLLYFLCDGGKWKEFEEVLSSLYVFLNYKFYLVIKCFFLLEESI